MRSFEANKHLFKNILVIESHDIWCLEQHFDYFFFRFASDDVMENMQNTIWFLTDL